LAFMQHVLPSDFSFDVQEKQHKLSQPTSLSSSSSRWHH
jgi:hypothetical protein